MVAPTEGQTVSFDEHGDAIAPIILPEPRDVPSCRICGKELIRHGRQELVCPIHGSRGVAK